MTIVESCATKSLVGLMKIEFRLITAAVIAVVLDSAAAAEGARFRPLDEDAALALLESTTLFTTSEFPGIVSRSAPRDDRCLF
jgi:hypothetical protein